MASTSECVGNQGLLRDIHKITTRDGQPLVMQRFRMPECAESPGVPVLLLHGLGQNRYTWYSGDFSIPRFLAGRGMDVFVPELRGHGLSREAGSVHPAGFEEYVLMDMPAVLEKINSITGGKKAFFCGHSLGGTIGYALEPEMERYLAGMAFIGSPIDFGKGLILMKLACRIYATAYSCTPLKAVEFFDKRRGFPAELYGLMLLATRSLQDSRLNPWPYKAWYPGSFDKDVLRERLLMGFDRTSMELMKFMIMWAGQGRLPENQEGERFERNLDSKTLPVLFFLGDCDCVVPAESVRPAFERMASKDKTWIVLDGKNTGVHWGHLDLVLGLEAPRRVWLPMAEWIEQRSEAACKSEAA